MKPDRQTNDCGHFGPGEGDLIVGHVLRDTERPTARTHSLCDPQHLHTAEQQRAEVRKTF